MIPRLPGRRLSLHTCILDRHPFMPVNALLLHGDAVEISLLAGARAARGPQLLAGQRHALVHAHQLALAGLALPAPEELPGAVDRPVSQVAVAGHPEGRRDASRGEEGEVFLHADDLGVLLHYVLALLSVAFRWGGAGGDRVGG